MPASSFVWVRRRAKTCNFRFFPLTIIRRQNGLYNCRMYLFNLILDGLRKDVVHMTRDLPLILILGLPSILRFVFSRSIFVSTEASAS